jgi:predicted RNase H-like HicB family nuclease
MKRFTYPVAMYTSEGMYALMLKDIDLVAVAETPEKAFEELQDALDLYFALTFRYDEEIPSATEYVLVEKETKAGKVLLISVKVAVKEE